MGLSVVVFPRTRRPLDEGDAPRAGGRMVDGARLLTA